MTGKNVEIGFSKKSVPPDASKRRLEDEVERSRGLLWQTDPERILGYKPFNLHYYDWIPFPFRRNFRGTIFADLSIYIQGAILTGYMSLLHLTGMGFQRRYLRIFVSLLGTLRVGAVINISNLITFILALFTTLMIQRWWDIRMQYSRIRAMTVDVCMIISQTAHRNDKIMQTAQKELTRLLNLAHLLLLIEADSESQLKGADESSQSFGKLASTHSELKDVLEEEEDRSEEIPWKKRMRELSFEDLHNQGLVTRKEWNQIVEGDGGLHAFEMVYMWIQDLIIRCGQTLTAKTHPEMFTMMTNKVNIISEAASALLVSIGSQMPYPYVQLVSFVVHACLMILATWLGAFLYSGQAGETFEGVMSNGTNVEVHRDGNRLVDDTWTSFWCYTILNLANFLFQGLLNLHELLDNPFGSHCAKFPLKKHIIEVENITHSLLRGSSKQLPSAVADITNRPSTPSFVNSGSR